MNQVAVEATPVPQAYSFWNTHSPVVSGLTRLGSGVYGQATGGESSTTGPSRAASIEAPLGQLGDQFLEILYRKCPERLGCKNTRHPHSYGSLDEGLVIGSFDDCDTVVLSKG